MISLRGLAVGMLVLGGGLIAGTRANAGPLQDWLANCRRDCPRPEYYSPARYWTPGLAAVHDCLHGPRLDVHAPDRYPDMPAGTVILSYPCPPVDPAATVIPVPTPPADSKFRY